MKNWKAFILTGLVLIALSGVLFAELQPVSPTVRPMQQTTTLNVVCLQAGFPTSAQVTMAQIDGAGNIIPGTEHAPINTSSGFTSFQVVKNLNYRVTAKKERRGFRVRALEASQDVINISTAAFVPLILSEEPASATETSINLVCVYKEKLWYPCRIYVNERNEAWEIIPGTSKSNLTMNGFASFRVLKNRNYRVWAEDVYNDGTGRYMPGDLTAHVNVPSLRSAIAIPLMMKLPTADIQGPGGVGLEEFIKDGYQVLPPTVIPSIPRRR